MPAHAQHLSELGVYDACGLLALIRSRGIRRSISPTKAMAVRILDTLRLRGVVEVPWPAAHWELPPRGYLTPIEQLSWDFVWPSMELQGLDSHLEDLLQEYASDTASRDESIIVWRALIRAECVEYFEFQLSKHGFEPTWSADLDWLPAHYHDDLSLVQWKYLIWSAVRHGAMECLRTRFNPQQTRNAIAGMLASAHRLRFALVGNFEGFLPRSTRPYSLMGEAFVFHATRLGFSYWTEPPSEDALKQAIRAASISNRRENS